MNNTEATSGSNQILLTKCVWQFHDKKDELQPVFDYFRRNVNEVIRIADQKNLTSRGKMHTELYHNMHDTEFYSKYVHGAISVAKARLKLYRNIKKKKPNAKRPYMKKNMLTLDNQCFKIIDGFLRFPIKAGQHVHIKLAAYVLSQLENTKLGSITITPEKLVISYSKMVEGKVVTQYQGIDRNLDNATSFDTNGKFTIHNLAKTNEIKSRYREVKSHFSRNDVRIRKKIFQKYGRKERNRVHSLLHLVSKKIASQNQGVIMEDIKGIRKLYQKGNGQGNKYRGRLNSWSFYELQRQIHYKTNWNGLPVQFIRAHGTSSKCSTCGTKLIPEENRMMHCTVCNTHVDRDMNAAKNILVRGLKSGPIGDTNEAMVLESKGVLQKVDVSQSNDHG